MYSRLFTVFVALGLVSCGGGTDHYLEIPDAEATPTPTASPTSSPTPVVEAPTTPGSIHANAGEDLNGVMAGSYVRLSGVASTFPSEAKAYQWTQKNAGDTPLTILNASGGIEAANQAAEVYVYIPAQRQGQSFTFTLKTTSGELSSEDEVVITTASCSATDSARLNSAVFGECISPEWLGLAAKSGGAPAFIGTSDQHVNWMFTDSAEHGKVVDVQFTQDGVDGRLQFLAGNGTSSVTEAPSIRDMRDYAGGHISFDVKVVSGALNSTAAEIPLGFYLECYDGTDATCKTPIKSSTTTVVSSDTENWQHFNLPVQSFLDNGLDLSKVSSLLTFMPAAVANSGSQQGLHFQIDNVHWEKPYVCSDTVAGRVFDGCLDTGWSGWGAWDQTEAGVSTAYNEGYTNNHVQWTILSTGDSAHSNVLDLAFTKDNAYGGMYSYTNNTGGFQDLSAYASGYFVLDYRFINPSDSQAALNFSFNCKNTSYDPCRSFVGTFPVTSEWTELKVPVSDLVNGAEKGFDMSKVESGFNIYPAWVLPQSGVHVQLDNIRWEAN